MIWPPIVKIDAFFRRNYIMRRRECSELREICSTLGYRSELETLSKTVNTVRAVLLDAEAKQVLSHQAQLWLEELKDAVYDADDLLDEFVTLIGMKRGGKASKEVRLFFSRLNPLSVAYNMSQGIKKIKTKLDAIARNHQQFSFKLDHEPIRSRREETCSYVYENDIIGREDDVEKIVGMLFDSDVQRDVSFLTIVGIGGLGKTALAQLVFGDERIKSAFSLKIWSCVSDHGVNQLDMNVILGKILKAATNENLDGSTIDQVQIQLRKQLAGRKYLIVLDDVWNENRDEWLKLAGFLMGGQRGSRIVVTTRSRETARVIENGPIYELGSLSEENSWRLFKRMAFEQVPGQADPPDDLVKIGQEVIKRCANVPLAIRVLGSLLYGQVKSKWLSFQEIGLDKIRPAENGIMSILKLSYHQLASPLKSCFSFCALFPKDFAIDKEMLISLWMSQGYIVPLDQGQSVEDAGEEYFSILLRRCFLQDVIEDEYGEIISCKIHDLMHDIAQEIAAKEISVISSVVGNPDKTIRHLSLVRSEYTRTCLSKKTHIRTFFQVGESHKLPHLSVSTLLANCTRLRLLDLSYSGITCLPESLSNLLHLRCLDLSCNPDLKLLPKSITKLRNLQTLKLISCSGLKMLPKKLWKLIHLRILDIRHCDGLTHMPSGMCRLTSLSKLTGFVIGEPSSCAKKYFDQLEDLKALSNLKGHLEIRMLFSRKSSYVKQDGGGGAYLQSKEHLNHIVFTCTHAGNYGRVDFEELLLEDMQPHSNLKGLEFVGYRGVSMPGWAREENLRSRLPKLVRVELTECQELRHIPFLGKLRHLKVLMLSDLPKLEYMEESSAASTSEPYYPSLERLHLLNLPTLRGWWGIGVGTGDDLLVDSRCKRRCQLPAFTDLYLLSIIQCPEMTSIPFCPSIKELILLDFNKRLRIIDHDLDEKGPKILSSCCTSLLSDPGSSPRLQLRNIYIDNTAWLKTLPTDAFQCLRWMQLENDKELKCLSEVGQMFQSCGSSLQVLHICHCPNLSSLSGGLNHLTALATLYLNDTPSLLPSAEEEQTEDGAMPWRAISQNLRYLDLVDFPDLLNLPEWIQYLTGLQSITVGKCSALQSMPETMRLLSSLTRLEVYDCSVGLKERCRNPRGKDWPNIRHIPHVLVTEAPSPCYYPVH